MDDNRDYRQLREVMRRLLESADRVIAAGKDLEKAREELSRLAEAHPSTNDPFMVVRTQEDDHRDDALANKILGFLRTCTSGEGLTRTDIKSRLGRNHTAARIKRALGRLSQQNLARCERFMTSGRGRPTERWYPVTAETTKGDAPEKVLHPFTPGGSVW
jgi:hypothetical protein